MRFQAIRLRAFVLRIFRRFVEEDFDQLSASLSFTTLLSIVPLVAVVLGVVSLMPAFFDVVERVDRFLVRSLLPEASAGVIVGYVLEFSQKAANVTLFGLLALCATAYLLLLSIERAFNHVWHVGAKRSWWRRLLLYVAVLTVWPFVIASVIAAISYAVTLSLGVVDEIAWLGSLLFRLGGFVVAAFFFATFYCVVPNTRVELRDALWAGCFATAGFFLMQRGFEFYLAHFPSYAAIYGAFATVPIFLLWMYLSWAVVLLGALIAATLPEFRRMR